MIINLFGTASLPADFAKKSFAAMLTRLCPGAGSAKLFALSEMVGTEGGVLQSTHGWWTKTMVFPKVLLNAAVADGVATTFTVISTADISSRVPRG